MEPNEDVIMKLNADLAHIRMVAYWLDDGDADGQDYRRAMQAFRRLDERLSSGGKMLPDDWSVDSNVVVRERPAWLPLKSRD